MARERQLRRPVRRTHHTTMKHRRAQWLVAAGLIMLSGCVHASRRVAEGTRAPDKNFYVFLGFGRSNMEGFPGVETM
jgi:hypothetical protein